MATRKTASKTPANPATKSAGKPAGKTAAKSPTKPAAKATAVPRERAASAPKASAASTPATAAEGALVSTPLSVEVPVGEARYRWIAHSAYLRAERRGFAPGQEVEDWLAAEAEFLTAYGLATG